MKKKSKVYIRLFLSSLGILIIPMVLAMLLYTYTFRFIRHQAEDMNENLMVMAQKELDQEIDNIQKIAIRMALDSKVQVAAA